MGDSNEVLLVPDVINGLGDMLFEAMASRTPLEPLTATHLSINVPTAYLIQRQLIARKVELGERVIGKKIGVTSKVVMEALGVYQPDFGMLTDAMLYSDGATIPLSTLIQPKAEGEIAFLLKKKIKGPGVTAKDVIAATAGVVVCFEIVDSRIREWKIKIEDTVADNASAGAFVLGKELTDVGAVDLINCPMSLFKNGELVATGTGAAALGNPAEAVAWLANALSEFGESLDAGEVILSGSLGSMVTVQQGDQLSVSIEGLGICSVTFS